MKIINLLQGGN